MPFMRPPFNVCVCRFLCVCLDRLTRARVFLICWPSLSTPLFLPLSHTILKTRKMVHWFGDRNRASWGATLKINRENYCSSILCKQNYSMSSFPHLSCGRLQLGDIPQERSRPRPARVSRLHPPNIHHPPLCLQACELPALTLPTAWKQIYLWCTVVHQGFSRSASF